MKIKSFYITASFACLFMLTSCVDYEVKDSCRRTLFWTKETTMKL